MIDCLIDIKLRIEMGNVSKRQQLDQEKRISEGNQLFLNTTRKAAQENGL